MSDTPRQKLLRQAGNLEFLAAEIEEFVLESDRKITELERQLDTKINLIEERDQLILSSKQVNWFRGFPQETGRFWFYGYTSAFTKMHEVPRLEIVTVQKGARRLFAHANGEIIYENVADGIWAKMNVPYVDPSFLETIK
ncbi:MAG TPA: hypothetical protein PLP33_24910 [Leptospiraceae bacterium]|nr:hypothetical protein [Leptospiraceae bacterium]